MLNQNSERRTFAEEFQRIIDRYNAGSIESEEAFQQLVGLLQRMSAEQRRAAEEEKNAERTARRGRYYTDDGKSSTYKRRPHIYIFRPEDLDNDDVISSVESTPTYKRTRQELDEIRSQAMGNVTQMADNGEVPQQGPIKFS